MQHKLVTLDFTDKMLDALRNRISGSVPMFVDVPNPTNSDTKAVIRTNQYIAEWKNILDDANAFKASPTSSYTVGINPSKTTALTNADFSAMSSEQFYDKVWQAAFVWLVTGDTSYIIPVLVMALWYANNDNGLGIDFTNEVRWDNAGSVGDGVGHFTFGHLWRLIRAIGILIVYLRTLSTSQARRDEIKITRWAFWAGDYFYRRFCKKRLDDIFSDREKYILNGTGISLNLFDYRNLGIEKVCVGGWEVIKGQERVSNRTIKPAMIAAYVGLMLLNHGHYLDTTNIGNTASKSLATNADIKIHLKNMVEEGILYSHHSIDWGVFPDGTPFEQYRPTDAGDTYTEQGNNYSLTTFATKVELGHSIALYNKYGNQGNPEFVFRNPLFRESNYWTFNMNRSVVSFKKAIYFFCDVYRGLILRNAILNQGASTSADYIDFFEVSQNWQIMFPFFYKLVWIFWNRDRVFAQYVKETILHKWAGAPDFKPASTWVGIGGNYKTDKKYVQNGGAFNTLFALLPFLHLENSVVNPF